VKVTLCAHEEKDPTEDILVEMGELFDSQEFNDDAYQAGTKVGYSMKMLTDGVIEIPKAQANEAGEELGKISRMFGEIPGLEQVLYPLIGSLTQQCK